MVSRSSYGRNRGPQAGHRRRRRRTPRRTSSRRPNRWPARSRPGAAHHRHRAADAGARRHHRERRAARHAAFAAPARIQPELGDQLLRARIRRTAAGRRPRGRPVRQAAAVPRGDRRLRPGVDGGRVRAERDGADHRPHRAGLRRRDGRPLRAVAARRHIPGRPGADQGPRRLRRDGRARLGGWPAARRDADRVRQLALGAVHQRADRHRRAGGHLDRRAGARRHRARQARRTRRGHRDPRHRFADLRAHPRRVPTAGPTRAPSPRLASEPSC
jgi:hypothetical protein